MVECKYQSGRTEKNLETNDITASPHQLLDFYVKGQLILFSLPLLLLLLVGQFNHNY